MMPNRVRFWDTNTDGEGDSHVAPYFSSTVRARRIV